MDNINNLFPRKAIVFENDANEKLILIENQTQVLITTDNTDFEQHYSGLISWINEDGITIEGNDNIPYEYIESIEII